MNTIIIFLKKYIYTIFIVIIIIFSFIVFFFIQLFGLFSMDYSAYNFNPEGDISNLFLLTYFIGPIVLLMLVFLNWRIYKKYGKRSLFLTGLIPTIMFLFILSKLLDISIFEPYSRLILKNINDEKIEKNIKNIVIKPEKICYMSNDVIDTTFKLNLNILPILSPIVHASVIDNIGLDIIASNAPTFLADDAIIRWEGKMVFPIRKFDFISNIGYMTKDNLNSIGGYSINGKMYIDEEFIFDNYKSDGMEHRVKIDFPVGLSLSSMKKTIPDSSFMLTVSLVNKYGDSDVPFYNYIFIDKFKEIPVINEKISERALESYKNGGVDLNKDFFEILSEKGINDWPYCVDISNLEVKK